MFGIIRSTETSFCSFVCFILIKHLNYWENAYLKKKQQPERTKKQGKHFMFYSLVLISKNWRVLLTINFSNAKTNPGILKANSLLIWGKEFFFFWVPLSTFPEYLNWTTRRKKTNVNIHANWKTSSKRNWNAQTYFMDINTWEESQVLKIYIYIYF